MNQLNQTEIILGGSDIEYLDYIISQKILGQGVFGQVREGYNKKFPKIPLAFKMATILDSEEDTIESQDIIEGYKKELEVYKKLQDRKHVLTYIDKFTIKNNNSQTYVLVTEKCDGNLKQLLTEEKGKISLKKALNYFGQLISGITELQKHGFIHRDIKPVNILYVKQNNINVLKLGDFGLAEKVQKEKSENDQAGSYPYKDPNIDHNQNFEDFINIQDMYSLGITLYYMLNYDEQYEQIDKYRYFPYKTKKLKMNLEEFQHFQINPITPQYLKSKIRDDLKENQVLLEFISKMIQLNKNDRFTWKQLFDHELSSYPKLLVKISINQIRPQTEQQIQLSQLVKLANKQEVEKQMWENQQSKITQQQEDQITAVKMFTEQVIQKLETQSENWGVSKEEIEQKLKPAMNKIIDQYVHFIFLFQREKLNISDNNNNYKAYILGLILRLQDKANNVFSSQNPIFNINQENLIQIILFLIAIISLESTFPFYEDNPIDILAWCTHWENSCKSLEIHTINKTILQNWGFK